MKEKNKKDERINIAIGSDISKDSGLFSLLQKVQASEDVRLVLGFYSNENPKILDYDMIYQNLTTHYVENGQLFLEKLQNKKINAEYIFLIGYVQEIPAEVKRAYSGKIINYADLSEAQQKIFQDIKNLKTI